MDKFCIGYRVVIAFLQQKSNQRSEKTYFSLLWPFWGRSGSRKVKNPLNFDLLTDGFSKFQFSHRFLGNVIANKKNENI